MDISIQELIDQREKALNYEDWEKYFEILHVTIIHVVVF